jgi:hypothetical protein
LYHRALCSISISRMFRCLCWKQALSKHLRSAVDAPSSTSPSSCSVSILASFLNEGREPKPHPYVRSGVHGFARYGSEGCSFESGIPATDLIASTPLMPRHWADRARPPDYRCLRKSRPHGSRKSRPKRESQPSATAFSVAFVRRRWRDHAPSGRRAHPPLVRPLAAASNRDCGTCRIDPRCTFAACEPFHGPDRIAPRSGNEVGDDRDRDLRRAWTASTFNAIAPAETSRTRRFGSETWQRTDGIDRSKRRRSQAPRLAVADCRAPGLQERRKNNESSRVKSMGVWPCPQPITVPTLLPRQPLQARRGQWKRCGSGSLGMRSSSSSSS